MKLTTLKMMAVACALAISSVAFTALAESGSSNPLKAKAEARLEKNSEIRNEKFDDLRELRSSATSTVRSLRKELEDDRKEFRASTTGSIKDLRENFRDSNDDNDDDCKNIQVSSTTLGLKRDCVDDRREDRREDRKDLWASTTMMRKEFRASTTDMFKKFKDDRKDVVEKMRKDAFQIRKEALVEHLNFALENLGDIRNRINERINKLDAEGKDTTAAEADLMVADTKIASAKVSIDALAALDDTSVSATASSTAEVELAKPRQVGDAAIKAVKDARDALKEVIQEIVKLVGKGRLNATTTASTTTTL